MKLKIFISSRNNDKVVINGVSGDTLTEIRKHIKKELEDTKFFGKDFFEIKINEDFGASTSTDSYNKCLEEVRDSDFCIALYTGASGWAPVGIDLGICHSELDTAMNISTRKTAIIDVTKYFPLTTTDKDESTRNNLFSQYLTDLNTFNNPLKLAKAKETNDGFKEELLSSIKNVIYKHLNDRIELSNIYFNLGGNNKISLNWKKLKYSDRDKNITTILKNLVSLNPDFKSFVSDAHSIPDNMSVEDAKAFTGRPFLTDQDLISIPKKGKPKYGPIHFIGVYGNATEIQVKGLIGFPDISAIKDDFGIYVWEQNTHVQLVLLTECKTPEAVKSKFLLFNNWCRSNGEFENICKRAEARYHILKSINEAKKIATK
ncbi:MAG: hypothetical protein ABI855_09350 [Bacteroidota bacterium]